MSLISKEIKNIKYPAKLLINGNFATLTDLYNVIETFTDDNLKFNYKDSRSIAEIIEHIICSCRCDYLNEFILGKKIECTCRKPSTIKEALELIQELSDDFTKIVSNLDAKEYSSEFETSWGQKMTKEIALFQSITHNSYHISEICFLAGLGGFYKGTLG